MWPRLYFLRWTGQKEESLIHWLPFVILPAINWGDVGRLARGNAIQNKQDSRRQRMARDLCGLFARDRYLAQGGGTLGKAMGFGGAA